MNRFVRILTDFFLRWTPDSFVVAGLLTLLTFALSVLVAGYGFGPTVNAWGDSFWNLLTFTNQIALTLLLGYALANTPPVKRGLANVAGLIRTPRTAYVTACLCAGVAAAVSWGLSLIVAGMAARAIGEACRRKGVRIHYPLLVASAYAGFVVWEQGLSSTVGLTLATPGHFLEDAVGVIPFSETIANTWNIGLMVVTLATLPFVMAALHPKEDVEEIPAELMPRESKTSDNLLTEASNTAEGEPTQSGFAAEGQPRKSGSATPAERIGYSPLLMGLMALLGLVFIYTHFVTRGGGLTLDIFNFCFLMAGLALAGSMERYVRIAVQGGQVAVPFLLQYPLYAGIAGVMSASGLAEMVVDLFVAVSSETTLPFFGFLSGGVLNIFIPSGGGQWAVQGPIMMSAALELDSSIPRAAMAVALGDEWTNLIHPLGLVPVLAISEAPLRSVIGYCFVGLLYTGVLFSLALMVF